MGKTAFADRTVAGGALRCLDLAKVQVNLGLRCNQACRHCHLSCGPDRVETMPQPVMDAVVRVCREVRPPCVDVTGGAPELHPGYRDFIAALRQDGLAVQSRTNLTVLLEPGMEDLPKFWSEQRVALVASMPCYLEENVTAQRGPGVYGRSIEGIRKLNSVGYGVADDLPLDLLYNPGGPFLPPAQRELEADYRRELGARFGIRFTRLLTLTNMPIGRFARTLQEEDRLAKYQTLLESAFNPDTVGGLMCRHQICVRWDGVLSDCDFNVALGLGLAGDAPRHIEGFDAEKLCNREIATGSHCFGCTAGCGSSCGGALVA